MPERFQQWIHRYNRKRFTILDLGSMTSTLNSTAVVVYADHSGAVWVTPLTEFLDKFEKAPL